MLEAKIPRSVFDGAECCRVTWNIGFGGERTVPRSGNSFSVEASQRFAIILDFYLLEQEDSDGLAFDLFQSKRYDEILEEFSDNEKLEYEIKIKKRIQADIKRDIRDTRIGSGCNILHLRGCISGNYDTSNRQRR